MEKFVSTEIFFWAFGVAGAMLGMTLKFIYDVWQQQNEIKKNYLARFASVEKKVEEEVSNLESKFDTLKEAIEHTCSKQQANVIEAVARLDDKLEKKFDQITTHLAKQDENIVAFWKDYGGVLGDAKREHENA